MTIVGCVECEPWLTPRLHWVNRSPFYVFGWLLVFGKLMTRNTKRKEIVESGNQLDCVSGSHKMKVGFLKLFGVRLNCEDLVTPVVQHRNRDDSICWSRHKSMWFVFNFSCVWIRISKGYKDSLLTFLLIQIWRMKELLNFWSPLDYNELSNIR